MLMAAHGITADNSSADFIPDGINHATGLD